MARFVKLRYGVTYFDTNSNEEAVKRVCKAMKENPYLFIQGVEDPSLTRNRGLLRMFLFG